MPYFFQMQINFYRLTLAFNARSCYNEFDLMLAERKRSVKMNIGFRENMTVEFKSDLKKLSDDVIIESVVAFANTDGGKFFLGVEDDGDITGLHPSHKDPSKLAAFIANKTIPPVAVQTELMDDRLSSQVQHNHLHIVYFPTFLFLHLFPFYPFGVRVSRFIILHHTNA